MLPDVILMDVMMPDMDGFTVCREIRSNPVTANVPIIMLTALDWVENKVKGFEAGADDYLSKPFETAELVARINVMTRRAEEKHATIQGTSQTRNSRSGSNHRSIFIAGWSGCFDHRSQPGSRVVAIVGNEGCPGGHGIGCRANGTILKPITSEYLDRRV